MSTALRLVSGPPLSFGVPPDYTLYGTTYVRTDAPITFDPTKPFFMKCRARWPNQAGWLSNSAVYPLTNQVLAFYEIAHVFIAQEVSPSPIYPGATWQYPVFANAKVYNQTFNDFNNTWWTAEYCWNLPGYGTGETIGLTSAPTYTEPASQ